MTTCIWLYQMDGQKLSMPPKSLSDSEQFSMFLNKLCGYGTMISMPSTLSWVWTILTRSQSLSLQRWYSGTYICRQNIHVIPRVCYQSCDQSQCKTLRDGQDHKPRPDAPIPWHQDIPQWYRDLSQSESLYHHNPQMIRYAAYSKFLDAHAAQCEVGLGRESGGEGIAWYHRLSSSHGITTVCSTCNSARYLWCSCCSFLLQFAAIHQPYDRC